MKAIIIIVLVVGALVGGLLTLRSSTRTGMPGADVLNRAQKRARQLDAGEKKDDQDH